MGNNVGIDMRGLSSDSLPRVLPANAPASCYPLENSTRCKFCPSLQAKVAGLKIERMENEARCKREREHLVRAVKKMVEKTKPLEEKLAELGQKRKRLEEEQWAKKQRKDEFVEVLIAGREEREELRAQLRVETERARKFEVEQRKRRRLEEEVGGERLKRLGLEKELEVEKRKGVHLEELLMFERQTQSSSQTQSQLQSQSQSQRLSQTQAHGELQSQRQTRTESQTQPQLQRLWHSPIGDDFDGDLLAPNGSQEFATPITRSMNRSDRASGGTIPGACRGPTFGFFGGAYGDGGPSDRNESVSQNGAVPRGTVQQNAAVLQNGPSDWNGSAGGLPSSCELCAGLMKVVECLEEELRASKAKCAKDQMYLSADLRRRGMKRKQLEQAVENEEQKVAELEERSFKSS
eukprot:TRINITY_DN26191_c0_g1_i1.p1 TRINITY_DN26191_c0_g1~~TRINITY_DN26191_c0_g1_i1.p1  ORF type:complete len:407 (-),score=66.27 TRINITY_DN26191_c0_g1_i1:371-1591(-)